MSILVNLPRCRTCSEPTSNGGGVCTRCLKGKPKRKHKKKAVPTCRECGVTRTQRGHFGLCHGCFDIPEVAESHRLRYVQAKRLPPRPPDEATQARPGSLEKIKIMTERIADNRHPHHVDDLTVGRMSAD